MNELKNLRRNCGLTQYELARRTRIHRWRISHAELGLLELTAAEVASVSAVLVKISSKRSARIASALSGVRKEERNVGRRNKD